MVVLSAFMLVVGAAAIARADEDPTSAAPEPNAACEQEATKGVCPDTDFTPNTAGKETELFKQVAGAAWKESDNDPATKTIYGSPTSFNDNLYTVAFSLQQGVGGLAGGATCENSEPNEDGDPQKESGCTPVLYQYKKFDTTHDEEWRQVDLPGQDDPGYIGAVAWISNTGQALAVGGTGRYPRRDPAYHETDAAGKPCQLWDELDDGPGGRRRLLGAWGSQCDPAGTARAWLYNKDGDGKWQEITEKLPTEDGHVDVAAGNSCNGAFGVGKNAPGCDAPPTGEPAKTLPRAGMHGLTALDCYPALATNFCFAGGLGQIWTWQNGQFVGDSQPGGRVDAQSPQTELQYPRRLRFRVRQIRFFDFKFGFFVLPNAVAVTSGCCAERSPNNKPAVLYRENRWHAQPLRKDPRNEDVSTGEDTVATANAGPAGRDANDLADSPEIFPSRRPDSLYSVTVAKAGADSSRFKLAAVASPGGVPGVYGPGGEPPSQVTTRYCPNEQGKPGLAGPLAADEIVAYDYPDLLLRNNLSTARLVSGDGDTSVDTLAAVDKNNSLNFRPVAGQKWAGQQPVRGGPGSYSYVGAFSNTCGNFEYNEPPEPDGVPDYVVGELRSTRRPGLGARGLLFANPLRPAFTPDTLDSPLKSDPTGSIDSPTGDKFSIVDSGRVLSGDYQPTDDKRLLAWLKAPYYLLPSYGLNAIDIVGKSASGWAVGDHGAILKISGESVAKQVPEPAPPKLGARRPAGLPDSSPYDDKAPETHGGGGAVPPLAAQPAERLAERQMLAAGAPDASSGGSGALTRTSAVSIAIARDGREGWAVGPGEGNIPDTTLYRYEAGQWSLCDPFGVPGQLGADAACERIAEVAAFKDEIGARRAVRLRAIARVPLENDADPANDDEFEAVAVGSSYLPEHPDREANGNALQTPAILRYRDGRWALEDAEARREVTAATTNAGAGTSGFFEVAFAAPDDGWALGGNIFHFDGARWRNCGSAPDPCFDPDRRLTSVPQSGAGIGANAIARGGVGGLGLIAAGERVYLYGTRRLSDQSGVAQYCPVVVYHDRGAASWHGSADGADGSLDPGFKADAAGKRGCADWQQMRLDSLAVARRADGGYEGWVTGQLVASTSSGGANFTEAFFAQPRPLRMLRLDATGAWRPFAANAALVDYWSPAGHFGSRTQALTPNGKGGLDAFIYAGRLFRFNPERQRWEIADSDSERGATGGVGPGAQVIAPDGQGGLWSVAGVGASGRQHFFHYTDRPPRPVFAEVPNPAGHEGFLSAASAGAGGQLWLATGSDVLYRYDRASGWDEVKISGWDPGRVVTRSSPARAIAVNESGVGVVVGEKGRIADIAGDGVKLDEAAGGAPCDPAGPVAPCGTGRDLWAAAVAPEGSAMIGGLNLALLWRDGANGAFRAIDKPDAAAETTITGISMPSADRAWLSTDSGLLFAGELAGGRWSWALENTNEQGDLLTLNPLGERSALRAIALDSSHRGYAVGDNGVVLRRSGGAHPWRRLRTPSLDDFTAVSVAADSERGALIGAKRGAIYALSGETFRLARAAETFNRAEEEAVSYDLLNSARPVVGLAIVPGVADGQIEAWAAVEGPPDQYSSLLHYASDPSEPLLDPERRAEPLPDFAAGSNELSFAAFGHTVCLNRAPPCLEMALASEDYETYTKRIVAEIAARSKEPGGPAFAVFSGDQTDTLGTPTANGNLKTSPVVSDATKSADNPQARVKLRRFAELIADRLEDAGVPFFAALGGGDITAPYHCSPLLFSTCVDARGGGGNAGENFSFSLAAAGDNLAWRQAMASRRAPWGAGPSPGANGLSFEAIGDGPNTVRADKTKLPAGLGTAGDFGAEDPSGQGLGETRVKSGGASTHYAFDVTRDGEKLARFVFLDSSLKTISAASDPLQNPVEAKGGQLDWLESMLCPLGRQSTAGSDCTRDPNERAIVVTNTPTYSYGPGQNETALDASVLEGTLLQNDADLVVAGRIGWNGLYYARSDANGAPVDHAPSPGGAYPKGPPAPVTAGGKLLPFLIASGGGKFAQAPDTSASAGFWHGYTIVHLDPETGESSFEQRPLLDWLQVSAEKHVLRPGSKLALKGVGREPVALVPQGKQFEVRDDDIQSAAITHRYDLVYADPEEPWLPRSFADVASGAGAQDVKCKPYVCLDPDIGTIDDQTGEVTAGGGQRERTYALAILSVADRSATFPLVFEPRPSFRVPPAPAAVPLPPASTPPPAPAPPPPSPPFNPPTLASPPPLPPLPPQVPLAPPAPPAPPGGGPAQLDLFTSPPVLTVAPGVSLFPPSAPVINVAPPTPARPVEKAKKVAVQKSGSGIGDDKSSSIREAGGDLATGGDHVGGTSAAATRRDPNAFTRHSGSAEPSPSFTPLSHRDQASAWARDLQWGGGLTLMALVLAFGWITVRPTPRRRQPEVPAPSWNRR